MLLLKDLGKRNTTVLNTVSGTYQQKNYGLFECPVCKEAIERPTTRGTRQNTCAGCRGTQNVAHGMSATKMYKVWQAMKARCSNPNHRGWHTYGGKGIRIDPNWETFDGYWADMGASYYAAVEAAPNILNRRKDVISIDRMDASKGYNKENCRWITVSQNSSESTHRRGVIQNRVVLKPERHYIEIARFKSAREAALELGLVSNHITITCQGKRKTHGGFNWEYINELS